LVFCPTGRIEVFKNANKHGKLGDRGAESHENTDKFSGMQAPFRPAGRASAVRAALDAGNSNKR